jgi:hypothetical protein
MSKAEAGNCRVFFIRHLTLLNTPKKAKFRKKFQFGATFLEFGARTSRQITSCASLRSLIPEVVFHLQE